ncbi:MAG: aspartate dehydrogenase domain-containing protein [Candidatus Omnitrophota bacterium]
MIKVGVCGCGTIGSYLIKTMLKSYNKQISLVGVTEINQDNLIRLSSSLKKKISSFSLEDLVKKSDLIIEAAQGTVVPELIGYVIKYKKQIMLMSVGGLLIKKGLLKKIQDNNIKLYIPSGAIAGLDALKAARMGKIKSVKLTTRKPVEGLVGAPYLINNKIDLKSIKKDTVVFQGSALQAVANFPKNINVAAILSIAGIGATKTSVCIVASPKTKRNTHTIEIKGDFGTILTCTENVPSKLNPKTSMMAILSAWATLDGILNNVKIGT